MEDTFNLKQWKSDITLNEDLGDQLNSSERKKLTENLNGYDISPDMVKMSLVNLYLHKFALIFQIFLDL